MFLPLARPEEKQFEWRNQHELLELQLVGGRGTRMVLFSPPWLVLAVLCSSVISR